MCSPTSIFQGHAVWHLINTSSIALAYLYYRRETFLTQEEQEVADTDSDDMIEVEGIELIPIPLKDSKN